MPAKEDLKGKRFSRLLVEKQANHINGRVAWLCKCDCGNNIIIKGKYLKNGDTRSCGCLKSETNRLQAYEMHKIRIFPEINFEYVTKHFWKERYEELPYNDYLRLSQQNCFYCGSMPKKKESMTAKWAFETVGFVYNGIDRIDSNKEHTTDNVVSACWNCNRAKRERTLEEFLIHISKLIINNRLDLTSYREKGNTINYDHIYNKENYALLSTIKSTYRASYDDGNATVNQFYQLSQLNCYYCNQPPSNRRNAADDQSSEYVKKTGYFTYNGLDRIDSNKSHDYDNLITCCKWCNISKSNLTLEKFFEWIDNLRGNFEILKEKCRELIPGISDNLDYT